MYNSITVFFVFSIITGTFAQSISQSRYDQHKILLKNSSVGTSIISSANTSCLSYCSSKVTESTPTIKDKWIYISPRLGFSMLTNGLGLEFQFYKFALNIGFSPITPDPGGKAYSYGGKLYLSPFNNSWFIGGGYTKLYSSEYSDYANLIGGAIGYSWVRSVGIRINVGLGAAQYQDFRGQWVQNYAYSASGPKYKLVCKVRKIIPMIELSLGYLFGAKH